MADNSLFIKINGSAKDFISELDKVKKKTKDLENVLGAVAKSSAIAFAGFATAIALTTNEFIKYEKALVGVGKTTDIEGKKLDAFGKQFQKLSAEIPITTNELLGIAQAAGQLGVKGEKDLLKFTETIAKLGVATDLTGEQAATSLTRILNVTGESISSIDTFGSVIVELGNNFAATESEIVRMATEVSRATAVFGVSAAESAALGTALKSVGVQAQLGGSAVGKAFRTIDKSIREGGASLTALEKITGQTGEQLKKTFAEDSVGTFQTFIEGLGRIANEGGSTAAALESLGLKGDEINKVLPVLAKNSELVGAALAAASKETKNATALNKEAEKAFNTLGAEKEKLINVATTLATTIGEELAPTIKEIVIGLKDFIQGINDGDGALVRNVATFLKWGAIISGVIASVATFALGVIKISALIGAFSAAVLPATFALSAFWVALTGPIGLAVVGIAAVTAGIVALVNASNSGEEPKTLVQITNSLKDLNEERERLEKNNNFSFRNQKALDAIKKEIKELEELRQSRIKATDDFGTGSLLIRPEADQDFDLSANAFGIESPELPFRPAGQVGDEDVKQTQENEKKKTEIVSASTQKRIDALKQANQDLLSIQKARGAEVTDEEKNVAQQRTEIDNKFREARKIENAQEREAAIANIQLSNAEQIAEIEKFESNREQRTAARLERQTVLEAQFKELSKEEQALFDEEDRERLEEKIITQEEAEVAAAEVKLERQRMEREQFLADEIAFGTALAQSKQFFQSQEVQGAKSASGQLIALSRSKNSTLSSIGKAAAHVNAAIATGEGAIKAYTSLAGIPVVGPALGAAAAGALIAFGVEQQANIAAANSGGVIPGLGPDQDSQLSFLTPGELVVPRQNFDEVVGAVAESRGGEAGDADTASGGGGAQETLIIELQPKGDLVEFIEQQIVERRVNGTGII